MNLITTGRAYGALGSVALLCYFVVPPVAELSNRTCVPPIACAGAIESGVLEVLGLAAIYCIIAGFLISRVLDREPATRGVTAAVTFGVALVVSAAPLWLMLRAAFW